MKLFGGRKPQSHADWQQASWLAWPTLSCGGGGELKVAGVYYHKDELRKVIAHVGGLAMAELRIEPDGEYPGAVRVWVGRAILGSIPHTQAPAYREVTERLHVSNRPATCRAQLEADLGEDSYVDVFLSARPQERAPDEPFLPPLLGATVEVDQGQAERLDESMQSRAKSKRVVNTGELVRADGAWSVLLEGERIGRLPSGKRGRLDEARAAGVPLTCRIRLIRAPGKPLRVQADFPSDR